MVVDDMANIPPRKIQSILLHPKSVPIQTPNIDMKKMIVQVDMMGEAPILRIFLNEKSRPNEKSRNITPISAQRCTFSISATEAVYGMLGLTRNPAMI